MKQSAKTHASALLDRVIELDKLTMGHYYEMGQLLSSIAYGKLWDVLGYESFPHLVEEELSFTTGSAFRYAHLYRNFRRLSYNKTESLNLLNEFGLTHMAEYLATAKQKVGSRAVGNRIAEIIARRQQVNFTLTREQHQEMLRIMGKLGLEKGPSGRFRNSSETFVEMLSLCNKHLPNGKPVLKAVG